MDCFANIPENVCKGIEEGLYLGNQMFKQLLATHPFLISNKLVKSETNRLRAKLLQVGIRNMLPQYSEQTNSSFGQCFLDIKDDAFLINVCRVSNPAMELPAFSGYKHKNAEFNPGNKQLSYYSPPITRKCDFLYYVLGITFTGDEVAAKIILPDSDFLTKLGEKNIAIGLTANDKQKIERRVPELIDREVFDNGKLQGLSNYKSS